MRTKAVRIHGANDLRLDEFELPPIREDEILAKVVSDSICMSTHKLAVQGDKHKRIRADLRKSPTIIGHEFCGELVEIGSAWRSKFTPGQRFTVQPALNFQETLWAPGYSYEHVGGDATYVILPRELMECGCLLECNVDAYFKGSLSEPMSCIVAAFHEQYHKGLGSHAHEMGIRPGGSMALLAGAGPMGLGAVDYALHSSRKPGRLVVVDIDEQRLARAALILSPAEARRNGVELAYICTKGIADPHEHLRQANGGRLYDDVFVFAPVRPLLELADRLLAQDGCLNFFAGPTDPAFSATVNFYDVHYGAHHVIGSMGGNTDDIRESLDMMARGSLNPVAMITHVGGLDAVAEATLNLDKIPGGKKLIYTQRRMELVAISDLASRGATSPFHAALAEIVARSNLLWSKEAEDYLLAHAPEI